MTPRLTVLMAVHNAEMYLRECVQSILDQTYSDFRFLILDDGSTDRSREVIRSFQDPRLELIEITENKGQIPALNKGLSMIDSPLIARMDADDISYPRRFERQVKYMDENPEIGIAGTFVHMSDGKKILKKKYPTNSDDIKACLLFGCCLAHPSVMMRKNRLDRFQLFYDEQLGHSEDWDLWLRAAECFPLANIPEYHLKYRIHEDSVTFRMEGLKGKAAEVLTGRLLDRLGLFDSPRRKIHLEIASATFNPEKKGRQFIACALEWLEEINHANKKFRIYSTDSLERALNECLFSVLKNNTDLGWAVLNLFVKKRLYRHTGLVKMMKFSLKSLFRYV